MELSNVDKSILNLLQLDSGVSIEALAEQAGVSKSAAQRRIRRLRENGVIMRDVAIVDPRRVGPSVTLLVELVLERDRPELLSSLYRWIERTAEVQQAWCQTGRGDYTLVVLAASIEAFDLFADEMMSANPNIRKFTTSVVLKRLKHSIYIPVT